VERAKLIHVEMFESKQNQFYLEQARDYKKKASDAHPGS
jgi:hypothetical protein